MYVRTSMFSGHRKSQASLGDSRLYLRRAVLLLIPALLAVLTGLASAEVPPNKRAVAPANPADSTKKAKAADPKVNGNKTDHPVMVKPSLTRPKMTLPLTTLLAEQFGGELEQWGKTLWINTAQSRRFRWGTEATTATSGLWQVSDKPFSGIALVQAPVLAKGTLTFVPGAGKVSAFEIDFAKILPQLPPAAPVNYYLRVVPFAGSQQVGPPSNPVTITYSRPSNSSTQFAPNMGKHYYVAGISRMDWAGMVVVNGDSSQGIQGAYVVITGSLGGGGSAWSLNACGDFTVDVVIMDPSETFTITITRNSWNDFNTSLGTSADMQATNGQFWPLTQASGDWSPPDN